MAEANRTEATGSTLSTHSDNGRGPDRGGTGEEEWVTLRRAAEETGVSISTLRSWYRKGLIDSRVEKGPNGSQRIVRLEEVARRSKPATRSEARATDSHIGRAALPADLHAVIEELAAARERAGRAEARADLLAQELAELRERPSEGSTGHMAALEAENRMLRDRLEVLRQQAEQMARRLSSIEGEPDEIDLTSDGAPAIPPEEEDEFLALTQRWKARRIRRRAARREAKAAR